MIFLFSMFYTKIINDVCVGCTTGALPLCRLHRWGYVFIISLCILLNSQGAMPFSYTELNFHYPPYRGLCSKTHSQTSSTTLLISVFSILSTALSNISLSISIPILFLPNFSHAIIVLPLPIQLSNTVSPSLL